jgi:hypothetical protein
VEVRLFHMSGTGSIVAVGLVVRLPPQKAAVLEDGNRPVVGVEPNPVVVPIQRRPLGEPAPRLEQIPLVVQWTKIERRRNDGHGVESDGVDPRRGRAGIVVVQTRDLPFATAGLARCGAPAVVEVWCDVQANVARARYEARQRHVIHNDHQRLAESWQHWAASAEPLNLGPTVKVKTDGPVDIGDVTSKVIAAFKAQQTLG